MDLRGGCLEDDAVHGDRLDATALTCEVLNSWGENGLLIQRRPGLHGYDVELVLLAEWSCRRLSHR
jgi:hypothetical protein